MIIAIKQVWFYKFEKPGQRNKAIVQYEKEYINAFPDKKRLMNTNLISKNSRKEMTRAMIREALACESLEATRQYLREWDESL
jgi:threonine aldolase